MDPVALVAIIVPSIALIYHAGATTQVVRELKKMAADHETRLRSLEIARERAHRTKIAEKNQNRM